MFSYYGRCCFFLCARFTSLFEKRFYGSRKPRLGKFHGYSIKYQNADHFNRALIRGFTRVTMKEHGLETGLEEMKVLVESRGQNIFRRLNDKKRQQLISIYTSHLSNILAMDENLSKHKLLITKLELPTVLNEILIYWKCFDDERDEAIIQLLDSSNASISRKFCELSFCTTLPQLKFVPDRAHLLHEEMNQLFALADYGTQYRALSHIGAVLGSTKETGLEAPDERKKKVPRWITERNKKLESGKEGIESPHLCGQKSDN